MASLIANGTVLNSPSPSLSLDDSEESFVVLSKSLEPDSYTMPSLSLVPEASASAFISQISADNVSQKVSLMSTSSNSDLGNREIQGKLEGLLQENLQLKDTLHQNNLAMKKQFSTLVMWQEDVMKVHQSHKEKFEETKKLIANLRAENTELKRSNSLPCANASENELLSAKAKNSALEFELDTLRQANIKYKNEHDKTVQELEAKLLQTEQIKGEQIKELEQQVESLKTQLATTQGKLAMEQQKVIDLTGKVPTDAETEVNELTKRQAKELSQELNLKKKMLKEKTDLLDKLFVEIAELKLDNETIPILKTQVEVYQTDFNQEREARSALKQEKDRITEDLQNLQRRNHQLLEEVDRLRESNSFVHLPHSAPAAARTPAREQSPPLATYICPICKTEFSVLRTLEDHIESCIENAVPRFVCPKCAFAFYDYQALENHVFRCIEQDALP